LSALKSAPYRDPINRYGKRSPNGRLPASFYPLLGPLAWSANRFKLNRLRSSFSWWSMILWKNRFPLFRIILGANDFYLQFTGLFTEIVDCWLCLPISIKRPDIDPG
jgi:hypothetical protein